MRRSTRTAYYRTALRLESLESRNVLSATAACMTSAALAKVQVEVPEPTSFVVVTGACIAEEAASGAVPQLANSNDFPEVGTCDPQAESSAVVVADLIVGPTSNSNVVAEVPTLDVGMPQGTLPDGVLRRRELPFPPLVLVAVSDTSAALDVTLTVETPITEFEGNVVITLNRPEQPVDTNVASTVLGSLGTNGETNGECAVPAAPSPSQSSTPVNTAVTNTEPVNIPPRGRASYRPVIVETPPLIVSPPAAREVVFATQTFQLVGAKPRRRA
jgi:hypothetical protein